MKIAWSPKSISLEMEYCIAGYGINDKSVEKLDDLQYGEPFILRS